MHSSRLICLILWVAASVSLVAQCAPASAPAWLIEVQDADATQKVMAWYKNNGLADPEAKAETIQIGNLTVLSLPSAGEMPARDSLSAVAGVNTVWPECQWATSQFTQEINAPVGLDEIDGRVDGVFNLPTDARGQGVDVYVIDTGVDVNHEQLRGRSRIQDFTGEGTRDDNGHGTHVSGTVAGSTVGIAREANIVGMKVFGASGSGSNQLILRALQEVSRNQQATNRPAVVNLSLGGQRNSGDSITERAITALTQQGIAVVVAAGNEAQNACNVSPAFISSAITVGAIDPRNSGIANFSNFGTCTDIFAPGVRVQSAATNTGNGLAVLSGTSMASPHVAGVMAAFMSTGLSNEAARAEMLRIAQGGAVEGNIRGSPNLSLRFN